RGIALLIKLTRHQEKTIGENRYHTNICSTSLRLGPTRGELHGPYGRASLQRRDRGDLSPHYHFVRLEPGTSRRPRFRSNLDGGRRELSLRIFRRPWKPAKPFFRALFGDDRAQLSRPERGVELFRFADLHGVRRRWRRRFSSAVLSDSVPRVSREARFRVGCAR